MARKKTAPGPAAAPAPKQETVERVMVFVGVRRSPEKGKRSFAWRNLADKDTVLDDPHAREPERLWQKQIQVAAGVGSIYRMKVPADNPDGAVIPQSGEFLGTYKDEDAVARWQVDHRAYCTAIEEEKVAKRAQRWRPDVERLEPFRNAYASSRDYKTRTLILADVIRFITTGEA